MDRVSMTKSSNKTKQCFIYYRLNNQKLIKSKFTYQDLVYGKLTEIVILKEQEVRSPRKILQKFNFHSNESLISIAWFYLHKKMEQDCFNEFIERLKNQSYPDFFLKSKDYNKFIKLVDPYFHIKIPRIEVSYDSKNL